VDWDRYIDATSEAMGLSVQAAWRPGVAQFLGLAAEMAATLERVELDDAELHLAPVYTPPDRSDG